MKLYYVPGACSLSPHIVAEEAGIALEYEKVNLKEHKTETGADYYTINPKGYVPALKLDDGSFLTEGAAIVQYLADRKPESKLAPANGTLERYHLQEWLSFINSEIHKNFGTLFGQLSDDTKNDARTKVSKRFVYVDEQLAGKDYLLGSQFTAADAYLFVMLTWARHMQIDTSSLANLSAYARRVTARPAVKAALKAEGLGG